MCLCVDNSLCLPISVSLHVCVSMYVSVSVVVSDFVSAYVVFLSESACVFGFVLDSKLKNTFDTQGRRQHIYTISPFGQGLYLTNLALIDALCTVHWHAST